MCSILIPIAPPSSGMGSATGLISGIVNVVCDDFPRWNKTVVAAFICVAGFAVGIVYVTPGGQFIVELVRKSVSRARLESP